jgi:hypothetical protein
MKIINPLYDYAFKYLMQNNKIAKKVLSTLIECEILELVIEQQEIVSVDEFRGLKLYRLDFSALIINEEGEQQQVLIELQKSKLPTNLLRFRTYLGENYGKHSIIKTESNQEEVKMYPIISIYILGYNVVDIPYLSVSIDNKITDTVTKEEVNIKSNFIELLTHKTRIIQIRRLSEHRRNRLEEFLSLFNQSYATSEKYILDIQDVPESFSDVASYLGQPLQDDNFRKKLRGEEEIDAIFRNQEAKLAIIEEELKATRQREEEARQREEEAKQRERTLKEQFARHLLDQGSSIDTIAKLTGLSSEEILILKDNQ